MERLHMKLEVLKSETMSKLNNLFREKVQLEERVKENEVQLQFHRGVLFAFDEAQKAIKGMQKAEQIEAMKEARKAELSGGDGSKDESKVPPASEVKA